MNNFKEGSISDSYAICLIGHGSRDPESIEEFLTLWKKLCERKICSTIEYGFLEFSRPTVAEALSACLRKGIKTVIILPAILLPGEHTKNDIPKTVHEAFADQQGINLLFAKPLGLEAEACQARIEEAEDTSDKAIPRSDTLLMSIAHGSRDTQYNSQVESSFQQLGAEMGFGAVCTYFPGTSQNCLDEVRKNFKPENFNRVVLFPFFLFTGVWVKRIYALADALQEKHPNIEFIKASCLKHHDLFINKLTERIRENIFNP